MSLVHLRVIAAVSLYTTLMLSCGKDSTGPDDNLPQPEAKTFAGKIISIDDDDVSWDDLRFGLITISTLEVMGHEMYHSGEAICAMDIGADSTFSFNLPAQIESRWVFMGSSCPFMPIAYNDTNGNGVYDCEPEHEPSEMLYEDCVNFRQFLYVSDPQNLQSHGIDISVGWNYFESLHVYSTDFDREFMMGSYSP